uniref:SDR family oxidoreductase n=1 Tax=Nonomuraea pusilla TaxID=46177 RepID=UPI0006E3EBD0|nr:NAD(P)H-binding protein [Nonomuraea pusilla]
MTRVLVTGASGRLGRAVVDVLAGQGYEVRAASRAARNAGGPVRWVVADLVTGRGVAEAVDGVDAVVHLASAPYKGRYTAQVEIDGTRGLLRAAREAGVGHVLYVSIVGADRVPWGYYRVKLRGEEVVRAGGVPWTILRATQFHGFVEQGLAALARPGFLVVDPAIPAQPVDVRDVAARLEGLLRLGPSRTVEEFGGPEVLTLGEAAETWLRARGRRRPVLRVRLPGPLGRAFRAGHLVTAARPTGTITWREYLAQ